MGVSTIEKAFPKIRKEGYKITSKDTLDYNCFAWSVYDTARWWSPIANNAYYWPDNFPKTPDVASFVKMFQALFSFVHCQDSQYEAGFEKIAIYADNRGNVTHAARQMENGKWTSKLGDWEDIEHATLEALEGNFYGKAVQILKRAVT